MARNLKGRLFKRGKAGYYYLQYSINGVEFRPALKDEDGSPITNEKKALKARDTLLAPYRAKNEVKRQEIVVAALNTAQNKATIADAIIENRENPPLKIDDSWAVYVESLNRPQSGERTLKNYHWHFSSFCKWLKTQKTKPIYMKEVTTDIANSFALYLSKSGKSANTYNKYISFLELFFRVLAKQGQFSNNPFADITRKQLTTQSRRELTLAELHKILDSATGDLGLLFALGTFTGLRLGDCCTLRWQEIDLENRVIKRVPNKTAARTTTPVLVGIPGPLYDRLVVIPVTNRGEFLLPDFAARYQSVTNGRPGISKIIQTFFKNIGFQTQKSGTGKVTDQKTKEVKDTGKRAVVEVGFHSLRHSYVSLHAMGGTPQAVIQSNVGHSNPAMTAHYTHTSMEAAVRVASALEVPFTRQITAVEEPERDRLIDLVRTLPLKKVKEVLLRLEKK